MDKRTKDYKVAVAALKALDMASKPLADARRRLTPKKKKTSLVARQAQTSVARAVKEAAKPVTIRLLAAHTISTGPEVIVTTLASGKLHYEPVPGTGGSQIYGPGSVTVSKDLAAVLLENERRLVENNANFEGHKTAFIGPHNREMGVHPSVFDSPMLNVLEAFHITR